MKHFGLFEQIMAALAGLLWTAAIQSCAIESAAPTEIVAVSAAPQPSQSPPQAPGNRAVIVGSATPISGWVQLDLEKMRSALENAPEKFKVAVMAPTSSDAVIRTIHESSMAIGPRGTLVVLLAGFANERGALTLADHSTLNYGSLLSATGAPAPRFERLAMIVAASLGDAWIQETAAMDRERNFAQTVIVTSVGHEATAPAFLHPAASRLLDTFRRALERASKKSSEKSNEKSSEKSDMITAIKHMQENHDLLYGAGPVIRIAR